MTFSYNLDAIDLSGKHPFRLTAHIRTKKKGSILCRNFPGSLWKDGGSKNNASICLQIPTGVFVLTLVGCIEGKSMKVDDGRMHKVAMQFVTEDKKYHLFVGGTSAALGLHSIPDHPRSTIRIGTNSALMKEFRGHVMEIMYNSDIVPTCLLHTSIEGVFGHLNRLEPLDGVTASVFQELFVVSKEAAAGSLSDWGKGCWL